MKYLGLAIACIVAVAAALFVINAYEPEPQPAMQPVQVSQKAESSIREVNVYVAARDIPIGSVIDPNMLTTRPWPEHLVVEGFVVGAEQGRRIVNTVVRAPFKRNEPINSAKLINPDDPNFMAGELSAGMRLVTMGSDEISAVAGFVFPGDRVDVLVTHNVLREGFSEEDLMDLGAGSANLMEEVTETLLRDVRVLAIDQRSTAGIDDAEGVVVPRSISLEVTPQDAQRVRLAEEIGRLSLALRSVEEGQDGTVPSVTRPQHLTLHESSQDSAVRESGAVRVIRGTEMNEQKN
jgi:pilus assembly protein CpaB